MRISSSCFSSNSLSHYNQAWLFISSSSLDISLPSFDYYISLIASPSTDAFVSNSSIYYRILWQWQFLNFVLSYTSLCVCVTPLWWNLHTFFCDEYKATYNYHIQKESFLSMYFLILDLTVLLRQMSLLTVYDDLTAISRIYLTDYNLGCSTPILCFCAIL